MGDAVHRAQLHHCPALPCSGGCEPWSTRPSPSLQLLTSLWSWTVSVSFTICSCFFQNLVKGALLSPSSLSCSVAMSHNPISPPLHRHHFPQCSSIPSSQGMFVLYTCSSSSARAVLQLLPFTWNSTIPHSDLSHSPVLSWDRFPLIPKCLSHLFLSPHQLILLPCDCRGAAACCALIKVY